MSVGRPAHPIDCILQESRLISHRSATDHESIISCIECWSTSHNESLQDILNTSILMTSTDHHYTIKWQCYQKKHWACAENCHDHDLFNTQIIIYLLKFNLISDLILSLFGVVLSHFPFIRVFYGYNLFYWIHRKSKTKVIIRDCTRNSNV